MKTPTQQFIQNSKFEIKGFTETLYEQFTGKTLCEMTHKEIPEGREPGVLGEKRYALEQTIKGKRGGFPAKPVTVKKGTLVINRINAICGRAKQELIRPVNNQQHSNK